MSAVVEGELADRLMGHVRGVLGASGIAYAEEPRQIRGGFDTSIYGFRLEGASQECSGPLILRVFQDAETSWRPGDGAQVARFEAAVQDVVCGLGYPAPRVLLLCTDREPLGSAFIIMERLPGRTMLESFFGPRILSMPRVLARTQAALHALNPAQLAEVFNADAWTAHWVTLDNELARKQEQIARLHLSGLEPGIAWMVEHRPPAPEHPAICHGDFHPLNIMTDSGRVTGVIDWTGTRIADAAYDVGATVALFEHGPVDLPSFLRPAIDWARRRLIARYLRAYVAARIIDAAAVAYYEALRCLGFLIEIAEERAGDRVKAGPFGAPHIARSLIVRLRQITGVRLSLERT